MKTTTQLQDYAYRGARAVLLLHEKRLAEFVDTWKTAKAMNLKLPESKSRNYMSLEALLRHVLYIPLLNMFWICEKLELPKPDIQEPPPAEAMNEQAAMEYLCYLLPRLREPLREIPLERFFDKAYPSKWKSEYCIDGMLEHILVHPQKHRFQLEELIEQQKK